MGNIPDYFDPLRETLPADFFDNSKQQVISVYKASLLDTDLHKRLEILRFGIDYFLRHNDKKCLGELLRKRFMLDGSAEIWMRSLENLGEEIKDTKNSLDMHIRALHPEIIAEKLYVKYRSIFEALCL